MQHDLNRSGCTCLEYRFFHAKSQPSRPAAHGRFEPVAIGSIRPYAVISSSRKRTVSVQLQGRRAALSPNVFCNEGFDLIGDPPLHKPIYVVGYRNPLCRRNQSNARGQTPATVRRVRGGVRHRRSRTRGFRSKPLAESDLADLQWPG